MRNCRLCGHWTPLGEAFCNGRDLDCYYEARLRLGVAVWQAKLAKQGDVERMRAARRYRRAA